MEQILAFILGVSAVAFVWVVVVAFKTAKQVKEFEKQFQSIYSSLINRDELVNRRIDQEINRVNYIQSNCISYTDSRVDKLEQKLTSVNNDGCEPIKKKLLKG
jgi:predicted PurR-regulated permease PerM